MTGLITRGIGGFYTVALNGGNITCKARGRFRKDGLVPLPGDRAEVRESGDGTGRLDEILPRKNTFIRPPVANIDALILVASAAPPISNTLWIDKILAYAEMKNVEPILCLNKNDLEDTSEFYDIYSKIGYTVIQTSASSGQGIESLKDAVAGKIVAFSGHSGVGKSSLLNYLLPEACMAVGEVSERLGRGRHTTRHVELFSMGNGTWVADTPGFSAFDDLEPDAAGSLTLPEFERYTCRFSDCVHAAGTPGCAVYEAVTNGEIHPSRYENYKKLKNM